MKSYLCNENYLEKHIMDTYDLMVSRPGTLTWANQKERLNRFINDCRLAKMISEQECDRLLSVLSDYTARAIKADLYYPGE